MIDPRREAMTLAKFRREKIMRIDDIREILGCAVVTARKRLRSWHAHTSYNHNGTYYTLPQVAVFDNNGLWEWKGVRFSRHGNLRQTFTSLVAASRGGLGSSELGKILGMAPRSFLWHFRDIPGIRREKSGGEFVYFSDIPQVRDRQQRKRNEGRLHRMTHEAIDSTPVLILVDRIKHPDSTVESCASRLRKQGKRISAREVRLLLEHHGLQKKTARIS